LGDELPERVDVMVVGSGIAGLVFALRASAFAEVAVVTKKDRPESNTNYAQGGIAAVVAEDDEAELHRADTLAAGAGLCHPDAVEVLVREGPGRIRDLVAWGAEFSATSTGGFSLGHEGGHSRRRIVRAADRTGWEVERALLDAVAAAPGIRVYENHAVVDLWTVGEGVDRRCVGAWVRIGEAGEARPIRARSVMLAAGGCGRVYRYTTNPAIATGDGVAVAHRAGARIANMEFVQFHPTMLHDPSGTSFLISEAVRGEGAVLVRPDGEPIMEGVHARGSLATRDVVARAIDREMKRTGAEHVLLDCTGIDEDRLDERFPTIVRETRRRGFDMTREPIPVVPAAHYECGGVLTDRDGCSTLPGLMAAGEVACTGVHGANRLASNSLLEAVVYAHRAAERLRETEPTDGIGRIDAAPPRAAEWTSPDPQEVTRLEDRIRDLMWQDVGIVRSDAGLARAADALEGMSADIARAGSDEARNIWETARLIVQCARSRRESRGLHFNRDHPYRDNERFLRSTVVCNGEGG